MRYYIAICLCSAYMLEHAYQERRRGLFMCNSHLLITARTRVVL